MGKGAAGGTGSELGQPLVEHGSDATTTFAEGDFEVGDAIESIGFGNFQWRLLMLTGMMFANDGVIMMQLSFLAPTAGCTFKLNVGEKALITSIVFIGMSIGSYACGVLSDKHGRRKVFLGSALWVAVFGIFSALSVNYAMLLFGQLLVGIGIGGVPVAFALFTEFLPTEGRGTQLVLIQSFWTVGVLSVCVLAWLVIPSLGWRWLLVITGLPNLVLIALAHLIPESPRYLAGVKGDSVGAMAELQRAADYNLKTLPAGTLRVSQPSATDQEVTVMDLFKHNQGLLTATIWVLWLLVTLLYYGVILLTSEVFQSEVDQASGRCRKMTYSDYREVFITSTAEIPSLIAAAFMLLNLGRKTSILSAFLGMSASMFVLVVASSRTAQALTLFAARGFANCAFTIIYMGTAEMYPTIYRTTGMGSASAMARVGGFAAPYLAQVVYDAAPSVAILLMAGLALFAAYVSTLLPEVSGNLSDSVPTESKEPAVAENVDVAQV